MRRSGKWLSKYVGQLISRRDEGKGNQVGKVILMNKIAVKLDVFCTLVEHRVSSDVDCCLSIRVNRYWQRRRNRQIGKYMSKPS